VVPCEKPETTVSAVFGPDVVEEGAMMPVGECFCDVGFLYGQDAKAVVNGVL